MWVLLFHTPLRISKMSWFGKREIYLNSSYGNRMLAIKSWEQWYQVCFRLSLNKFLHAISSNNLLSVNPAGNYMFKVSNGNTRLRCEICSKLTRKTPERRQASFRCLYCEFWTYFPPCSSVSIVNFNQVNTGSSISI